MALKNGLSKKLHIKDRIYKNYKIYCLVLLPGIAGPEAVVYHIIITTEVYILPLYSQQNYYKPNDHGLPTVSHKQD